MEYTSDFQADWTNVLGTESLLCAWFSSCMLLLANALLFFHMSRVKSIVLSAPTASLMAISFIIIGVALLVTALVCYGVRATKATALLRHAQLRNKEKSITITHIVLFSFIVLLFLSVVFVIAKDSLPVLEEKTP